jgi:hypothetical protein
LRLAPSETFSAQILTLGLRRLSEDWHLLDDFHVEALQCGDVRGGVREEPNLVDAEIGKNLAAESDLTQDSLMLAIIVVRPRFAMEKDAVRLNRAVDVESAAGVVEIDECAASGLGDLPE